MKTTQELKEVVLAAVDSMSADLIKVSHDIHGFAEVGFNEYRSVERLTVLLKERGFDIVPVKGMPTAFVAKKGESGPKVAFMAEYDALPEIGHACGHNIIAASAIGAALAIARVLDETGGTVLVVGCPAEENGSGKIHLVDRGVFDGIDAAMIVHPADEYMADDKSLAIRTFKVEFFGKASHAASAPEQGINALDAAVEFLSSINSFRQHMTKDGRIHAIITHGGSAVNVIPDYAAIRIAVRATTLGYLDRLCEEVKRRAEGVGLATSCKVAVAADSLTCREIRVNRELSRLFESNFRLIGIEPKPRGDSMGSTDVGNVSHVVPTIQAYVGIGTGLATHTVEFREAAVSPEGDKAVLNGAKVMALTAVDILTDRNVLERIRKDHAAAAAGQ